VSHGIHPGWEMSGPVEEIRGNSFLFLPGFASNARRAHFELPECWNFPPTVGQILPLNERGTLSVGGHEACTTDMNRLSPTSRVLIAVEEYAGIKFS
jgi:hypothetical protein